MNGKGLKGTIVVKRHHSALFFLHYCIFVHIRVFYRIFYSTKALCALNSVRGIRLLFQKNTEV